MRRIVVDASAALHLLSSGVPLGDPNDTAFVAPPLLWSEVTSALHEAVWRGAITQELADDVRRRLDGAPIERQALSELYERTWTTADEFGWAKTYDAEYVALAALLGCPLLTVDARLARTASRVVQLLAPADL